MTNKIIEIVDLCFYKSKDEQGKLNLINYLNDFLDIEPQAKDTLEKMYILAIKEDNLLVSKGLINILSKEHPATFTRLNIRRRLK